MDRIKDNAENTDGFDFILMRGPFTASIFAVPDRKQTDKCQGRMFRSKGLQNNDVYKKKERYVRTRDLGKQIYHPCPE